MGFPMNVAALVAAPDAPLPRLPCPPGQVCELVAVVRRALLEQGRKDTDEPSETESRPEGGDGGAAESLAEHALLAVRSFLPCNRCKGAESMVQGLRRLGHVERGLLLAAAAPDTEPSALQPPPQSRSAAETERRALRTLARRGLLTISGSRRWGRTICRTLLGQVVVERLGPTLQTGTPIRWRRHRVALAAAPRLPVGELLAELHAAVTSLRETITTTAALRAMNRWRRRRVMTHDAAGDDDKLALLDVVIRAIDAARNRLASHAS